MISFDLPKELIAQEPARPRDSAKLLVYDRVSKTITDSVFSELDMYLHPETTLVLNNSKVENCRWLFAKPSTPASLPKGEALRTASFSRISSSASGEPRVAVPEVRLAGESQRFTETASSVDGLGARDIEIFVLEKLDQYTVRALVRPGKKFKLGATTELTDWLMAETTAIDDEGIRTIRLNVMHDDERLRVIEHVPLPPYIAQNDTLAAEYQTVYAKPLGSKAAPTAGLHFTDELLDAVRANHAVEEVTLHVGLGTFAGLTDENFKTGKLHEEWYEVDSSVAEKITQASHVTAVGTTTVRTLESYTTSGDLMSATSIFIQPGYEFQRVNSLITNFHLPGTSLLLLVEALVGSEAELQRIYDHAIQQKYRFYSFGDAMLIL